MTDVKTVTIRNGTFLCELYLTTGLGTMPVPNWRKLLRLAMDGRKPWAEWYEENGKALRTIRWYLPELVHEAEIEKDRKEETYKKGKKPVKGDAIEKSRIRDYNNALKWAAQEAAAKHRKLCKLMLAFVEETQNYVL